jgi:phosphoglycerol transferase MdoB-like AlkP superfamily enzyme
MALREFFNAASKEPWFDSTLFVLTADHTNELVHEVYQNDFGNYSVPIILYQRGSNLTGVDDEIVEQSDIMPTILNYLNYDKKYFAFGNDMFDKSFDHYAFNSSGSIMQLYKDDYLLQMLDGKTIGLYNFKTDPFIRNNLQGKVPEIQQLLETKLHAILQTYNERLIDNKMTVSEDDK